MPMKLRQQLFKHVDLVDVSDPFDVGDIGHAIMADGRVQIIGKRTGLERCSRATRQGGQAGEHAGRANHPGSPRWFDRARLRSVSPSCAGARAQATRRAAAALTPANRGRRAARGQVEASPANV